MFKKILIANRGEVAVRVIKTCKRLGLSTVVVYSEADAHSSAVEMSDEAVLIGGSAPSESYLAMAKIIEACKQTGAEAVHPGFGFLSENAAFPKALDAEGVAWIGPNSHAISAMGDKLESKKLAAEADVNTVPGFKGEIETDQQALDVAQDIGFPVMIKASAGGGGKGMRIARSAQEVREGFTAARNEARSSFGDERILIEKFIESPRHIEIQVLGDKHGHIIHLNERECSIQRRNQKVLEEAPSPFLDEKTRQAMGAQAVALAKAVDYDSAGTVEFIVDPDKNFYFLEMNTRLQVEHPVTELTHGVDLVEQMILMAAGEKLAFTQKDMSIKGWAVEARLYAEDPYREFLPSIGRLKRYIEPAEGALGNGQLRIDSGVREGDEISMFYDPMIAKVVGQGNSRTDAIDTLLEGLDRMAVEGLQSNKPFLSAVLEEDDFRAGNIHTGYIDQHFPDGFMGTQLNDDQSSWIVSACAYSAALQAKRAETIPGRLVGSSSHSSFKFAVILDDETYITDVLLTDKGAELTCPKLNSSTMHLKTNWRPGLSLFKGRLEDACFCLGIKLRNGGIEVTHRGYRSTVWVCTPRTAQLVTHLPEKELIDTTKLVTSPMPGLVVSVAVECGQSVKSGQALMVVEAMKMENVLRADRDGVIKLINCEAGASVAADELLIEFE